MYTIEQVLFTPFKYAFICVLIVFIGGIIYWFINLFKRHQSNKAEGIFQAAEEQHLKDEQAILEEKYKKEREDLKNKQDNLKAKL